MPEKEPYKPPELYELQYHLLSFPPSLRITTFLKYHVHGVKVKKVESHSHIEQSGNEEAFSHSLSAVSSVF
jgi:hypothetical protein